jgi:hypothetical protein
MEVTTKQGNIMNHVDEADNTRVFFVTDSLDNNEEIFETLEEAEEFLDTIPEKRELDDIGQSNERRLRICLVRHAYKEANGGWNYDDCVDTFETIKALTPATVDAS